MSRPSRKAKSVAAARIRLLTSKGGEGEEEEEEEKVPYAVRPYKKRVRKTTPLKEQPKGPLWWGTSVFDEKAGTKTELVAHSEAELKRMVEETVEKKNREKWKGGNRACTLLGILQDEGEVRRAMAAAETFDLEERRKGLGQELAKCDATVAEIEQKLDAANKELSDAKKALEEERQKEAEAKKALEEERQKEERQKEECQKGEGDPVSDLMAEYMRPSPTFTQRLTSSLSFGFN